MSRNISHHLKNLKLANFKESPYLKHTFFIYLCHRFWANLPCTNFNYEYYTTKYSRYSLP